VQAAGHGSTQEPAPQLPSAACSGPAVTDVSRPAKASGRRQKVAEGKQRAGGPALPALLLGPCAVALVLAWSVRDRAGALYVGCGQWWAVPWPALYKVGTGVGWYLTVCAVFLMLGALCFTPAPLRSQAQACAR